MTATQVQESKQRAHDYGKRAEALRAAVDGELKPEQVKEINDLLDKREAALAQAKADQRLLDNERAEAEAAKAAVDDKPKEEKTEERSVEQLRSKGFMDYLRFGEHGANTRDPEALRAAIQYRDDFSGSIDTEGGFFMPPMTMLSEILKQVEDQSFMRQISRVVGPVPLNGSLGYPYADRDGLNFEWGSELTSPSPTDMQFSRREMKPNWYTGELRFSRVLLAANTMNVESYVRGEMAIRMAEWEEQYFMYGHGGARPLGVFVESDVGIPASRDIETASNSDPARPSYDDIINTYHSLKATYQRRSSWLVSREFMRRMALIKDGDNRPLWREGLVAGDPATILTRPVYISEYAPAGTGGNFGRKKGKGSRQTGDADHDGGVMGTYASGDYMAILGDFSYNWIVDSVGMSVQRLEELYARRNQIGMIMRHQIDSGVQLEEAFVRLKAK